MYVKHEPVIMSRSKSIGIVIGVYLGLLILGITLTVYLPQTNTLSKLFLIDVILTLFIFIFSLRFANASLYDPFWSVIPIYMIGYWWHQTLAMPNYSAWVVTTGLVCIWGVRLTLNWGMGWQGMQHQDWRYVQLQEKTGKWYVMVNFLGIHIMPTLLVWMGTVPLAYIFTSNQPFSALNWIGVGVALVGVGIETISDIQLKKFKKNNASKAVLSSGVWGIIRHPNYLGEILFWWGLYFMAFNAFTPWYIASGSIAITLLFIFVSIPMMDKHLLQKRPEYAAIMLTKGTLIPKFWVK